MYGYVMSELAIGCYVSLGDRRKAKEFLDEIPKLLERKKIGGKDLPTEVFIRKKREQAICSPQIHNLIFFSRPIVDFYKRKQKRRGGDEDDFVDCIKISPAEGPSLQAYTSYLYSCPTPLELAICAYLILR